MTSVTIEYQGDLHCKATHELSGAVLTTDAPRDNHGRGESFSPTDLVGVALGTCTLSVMGIKARMLKVDISGSTAAVDKEMVNAPARKINKISVKIRVPHQLSSEHRQALEEAAYTCPVHKSMHPDVEMPIEIAWG
jgi:putative redox protein